MEVQKTLNKKQLRWYVLSFILYKIAYEIMYATTVSKIFTYYGIIHTPNPAKGVLSYIVFFIMIAALPKNFSRVSAYLVNIFFIYTMLPILSFYWQANKSTQYFLFCSVSFLLVCLICRLKLSLLKMEVVSYIRVEYILLFATVAFILALTVSYGIADLRAMNILRVYEVRSERSFASFWGYLINWVPSAFLPCLMCIALYYKKMWLVVLSIIMQAYLYLFTGNKTVLFSIVLILLSYLFVNMKENFSSLWLGALSAVSAVACAIYWLNGSIKLLQIIPVRLFSIPAMLSFHHYEFFSQNPKLHLSESIFGRILDIESPYSQFSTMMVSPWGRGNANTGYLADAYDNGGFILMIVYSILLGLILVLVDMISSSKTLPVFVAVFTYTMIILTDAPLLTTLLTGGFILNIVILYLFKKQDSVMNPSLRMMQRSRIF